jgi:hypothetical protein
MENYILVLFFIGVILTIIGYYKSIQDNCKTKTIYKYIDQSIEEAQKGGQYSPYNKFIHMFTDKPLFT